jgi:hypothetical protein
MFESLGRHFQQTSQSVTWSSGVWRAGTDSALTFRSVPEEVS